MRDNAVFVGGSLPLLMFSPVKFLPSNADLFVPLSRKDVLVQHLQTMERYHVSQPTAAIAVQSMPAHHRHDTEITSYGAGLITVTQMRRSATVVNILTYPDPLQLDVSADVITLSWTTLLFNFVTADYAVSGYPSLTLTGRGLFHMERFLRGMPGGSSDHKLNQYAERGFEFSGHPSWWFPRMDDLCPRGWTCPLRRRFFGDGGTLIIPAQGTGVDDQYGRNWMFGGVTESVHE